MGGWLEMEMGETVGFGIMEFLARWKNGDHQLHFHPYLPYRPLHKKMGLSKELISTISTITIGL